MKENKDIKNINDEYIEQMGDAQRDPGLYEAQPLDRSQIRSTRYPYRTYTLSTDPAVSETLTINTNLGFKPRLVKVDYNVFATTEPGVGMGVWTEVDGQDSLSMTTGGTHASTTDIAIIGSTSWAWTMSLDTVTNEQLVFNTSGDASTIAGLVYIIVTVYE